MKEYLLWLAKVATILVIVFIVLPIVLISIAASATSSLAKVDTSKEKGIAVVEVKGAIISATKPLKKLYESIEDEDIIGIVLDIDSPGGSVAPSQQIYATVNELKEKKPIVAVMNGLAASGGLYAALGASKVLAQPGTLTGSIGVILQLPNVSKISDQLGFQMITIKSGDLKDVGNSFRPMSQTDKDFLQSSVNKVREHFVDAVVDGRGIERSKVDAFADGRIILGSEAMEYGLVDGFGTIYDAGRMVHELAGEPLEEGELPNLLIKEDKFDRIREILESANSFIEMLQGATPSLSDNGLAPLQ